EDEALPGQVRGWDLAAPAGQRMVDGREEDDLVVAQRAGDVLVGRRIHADRAQVDLVRLEPLEDAGAVPDDEPRLDRRIEALELGHPAGQDVVARRRAGADREDAAD